MYFHGYSYAQNSTLSACLPTNQKHITNITLKYNTYIRFHYLLKFNEITVGESLFIVNVLLKSMTDEFGINVNIYKICHYNSTIHIMSMLP